MNNAALIHASKANKEYADRLLMVAAGIIAVSAWLIMLIVRKRRARRRAKLDLAREDNSPASR